MDHGQTEQEERASEQSAHVAEKYDFSLSDFTSATIESLPLCFSEVHDTAIGVLRCELCAVHAAEQ